MNISLPFQPFLCHVEGLDTAAELAGVSKPELKVRKAKVEGFYVMEITCPIQDESFWRGFVAGKNWTISNRQSFNLVDNEE